MLISIVIPVYNVEKYLNTCLDSIFDDKEIQQHIEVIAVNDGSTDNSGKILDDYKKQYNNIVVKHTKNSGQSTARNTGIKLATGKYVLLLDSDDYYIKGTLRLFIEKIIDSNEPDLIIGKIKTFYEDSSREHPKANYVNFDKADNMTGREAFKYFVETNQFVASAYSLIVKKNIILENNIQFNPEIKAGEDIVYTPKLYFYSETVAIVNVFFHMYRKNREGQITSNITIDKEDKLLQMYNNEITNISSLDLDKQTENMYSMYIANLYAAGLSKNKGNSLERFNIYKKYSNIIDYTGGKRFVIQKYIYKIFGFKAYIYVMRLSNSIYKKLLSLRGQKRGD